MPLQGGGQLSSLRVRALMVETLRGVELLLIMSEPSGESLRQLVREPDRLVFKHAVAKRPLFWEFVDRPDGRAAVLRHHSESLWIFGVHSHARPLRG
jgi:hypothetical protein